MARPGAAPSTNATTTRPSAPRSPRRTLPPPHRHDRRPRGGDPGRRSCRWGGGSVRRGLRGALGLVVVAFVLGAAPGRAMAHATYERSDPSPNAILARAPSEVRVWFTEDAELRFSELRVYDGARHRVDRDNLAALPGSARALVVGLGDLSPGTYSVAWKTVSAVDGHVARGAFPFTVGLDQTPAPVALPGT